MLAEVQLAADPAASHAAKEQAHRAFKGAVMFARDRSGIEAAALAWLTEINRINTRLRVAQTRLRRERETADSLLAERDRLAATAEAAHTMAAAAREACLAAQSGATPPNDAVPEAPAPAGAAGSVSAGFAPVGSATAGSAPAAPQIHAAEMAALGATPEMIDESSRPAPRGPGAAGALDGVLEPPPDGNYLNLYARPPQLLARLLRRDIITLNWLVDQLAAGSINARSAWKLRLSNLVDAVIAAAIDNAFFDFPHGSQFWDQFAREQTREIARGLAALGYRYDGFGEFVDGRVPDQRDLALAIGSAGLLPVRVRYWPKGGEYGELFRDVHVAADQFLATRAASLTLGSLLVVLDRRAEFLADLWNDWARVRPLLLSNPEI